MLPRLASITVSTLYFSVAMVHGSLCLSVSYLVLVLIKILMIVFISKLHVQLMLAPQCSAFA